MPVTDNFTVQHSMTNTDIRVKPYHMGEVKKKKSIQKQNIGKIKFF